MGQNVKQRRSVWPRWRAFDPWREQGLMPPPEVSIDKWAEATVVLPRAVAADPGPMRLDRTPYLREVLQAATDPEVEEIALMFSTQVGKTTACILMILHALDVDPWPCLHVCPRDDDAASVNVDRYQRIILESPGLREDLSGAAADMTRDAIRLNGASVHFVGANSPAGLASRAACYLVLDETDKFPPFAGREADPIALARERTRTFYNRKIIKCSTPTTEQGYIHQEFLAGDRREFWVPCPHCEGYQLLVMGGREPGGPGIHWPAELRDPERMIDEAAAWYECEHCHQHIPDIAKPGMLRRGRWVPASQRVLPDGSLEGPAPSRRRLSYHLSALYSPWLTWSRIGAEFLRSKDAINLLMNFRNSWEGLPWAQTHEEVKDAHLRSRVADYQAGTIPRMARVLTAGVDVQLDHLWYVIRAWGPYGESWLVRAGRVEDFTALHRVLFESKYLIPGTTETVPLEMVFIDSGYRTYEVYDYCRRSLCQPCKGDARLDRAFSVTHPKRADGSEDSLASVNVAHYKTKLHRLIKTPEGNPGAWHLPQGLDEDYFVHMVAEQQVRVHNRRTGQVSYEWKVRTSGAPNHLFDAEVYALVAADSIDVEHRFVLPAQEATVRVPEPLVAPAPKPQVVPKAKKQAKFRHFRSRVFSRCSNAYEKAFKSHGSATYAWRNALQSRGNTRKNKRKPTTRRGSVLQMVRRARSA